MRLLKKLLLLLAIASLTGCGYQSIYSQNQDMEHLNFGFVELNIKGDQTINKALQKSLERYKNLSGKTKLFKITINTDSTKEAVLKDTAGNATIFLLTVRISMVVEESGIKGEKSKVFIKKFRYNNDSNKFSLKRYEASFKRNLTTEISRDMIQYLSYIR